MAADEERGGPAENGRWWQQEYVRGQRCCSIDNGNLEYRQRQSRAKVLLLAKRLRKDGSLDNVNR